MKQPDKQGRAAQVEQGSVSPRKPDQDRLNYLIEEYRMLRTEIESYTKQKRQLEISVITAVLIIYGFAATSRLGSILESLVLATPVVIVLWGIYRFIFYNRVIKKEVQYVKEKIEPIFMGSEGGWEAFWEKTKTWGLLKQTEYVFWIIALLVTLAVPFLWPLVRTP
jgi:hypothetical protein